MSAAPPGVLLFEGGTEEKRLAAATRWAKTVNCPQKKDGKPCGECPVCRQIDARAYLDVWYFDGRISNKEDEENPGVVAALRIENIRKLKAAIGVKPHGEGKRIAIIQGMYSTREEALNTMLKTLEEPGDFTLFALLVPQRQQILPTLVSRSLCLTLPWESSASATDEKFRPREDSLGEFIEKGNAEFLDQVAAKGEFDAAAAADLLTACQRSLIRAVVNEPRSVLDNSLMAIARAPERFALCSRWLAEGQEMLTLGVTPARVLEALGSRLYALRRSC